MARLSLTLILIMLSIKSFPQTVFRNVIATGGNSITASGYVISSTIGQIPFQTLCETTNALTQGFEQPASKAKLFPGESIEAFPNPVNKVLNLIFSVAYSKDFIICIFNISGNEIYTQLLPEIKTGILYTVDFTQFPDGIYLIHIYEKSDARSLFKVIKIEKFSKTQ